MTQAVSTVAHWLLPVFSAIFLSATVLASQEPETLITVEREVGHSDGASANSSFEEYSLCQCFQDNSICSTSHTIIHFNSGVYDINACTTNATTTTSAQFLVRDIENFTLTASYQVGQPVTTLNCSSKALFVFINVTNLKISGITFLKCGAELTPVIFEALDTQTNTFITVKENFMATLFMLNIMTASIDSINVREGEGFGLLAVNTLGVSEVINSAFSQNNYERFMEAYSKEGWCSCNSVEGGNAVFAFVDGAFAEEENILRVLNTTFTKGATSNLGFNQQEFPYGVQKYNITSGAGLSIILAQTSYNVSLGITKVKSFENIALTGANIMMAVYDLSLQGTNSLQIKSSEFSCGNTGVDYTRAEGGGMMYICGVPTPYNFTKIYHSPKNQQEQTGTTSLQLILDDIQFHKNKAKIGGGLSVWEINKERDDKRRKHTIFIYNCSFVDNIAMSGSAMYIFQSPDKREYHTHYPFRNEVDLTVFRGNGVDSHYTRYDEYLSFQSMAGSVISFDQVQFVALNECIVQDNTMVGILSVSSSMYFHGENTFRNNSGIYGGAIAMYLDSIMYLENNTLLRIIENRAHQFGGGIYISGLAHAFIRSLCPYQLHTPVTTKAVKLEDMYSIVYMRNNTANITGDAIFGGDLENCSQLYIECNPQKTFNQTFDIDVNLTDPEQTGVSSEPMGPCFCENNIPNCTLTVMNKSVFSGERFKVSLVGVGQFNGLVPSVIVIDLYINTKTEDLSLYPRKLRKNCTTVEYYIYARNNATLILHTDPLLGKYFSREIHLTITECPLELGYRASTDNDSCVCDDRLKGSCKKNGKVTRKGTVWLGFSKGHTLYHPYCPYDYCKDYRVEFKLNESHKQCRYYREGILCGACPKDRSLSLGISMCKKCSNRALWILIVFALAGLGLVVLLFISNLTVAAGTINGLIIYANIIQTNHFIFFPDGKPRSVAIPVAWLNLDVGVRKCLYNGLNGYTKTWLQFLFPAYIWGIALLIIVASRWSRFVQRMCGPNAVQVLATLFLLSYGKLQRTVIVSLSCTVIEYNKTSIVWMYDGNVPCFRGQHLILALFSMLIELCFIIPMMLLLLFAPQLQAWSHKTAFKWVNTLKPLIDAYHGPYKGKHRRWLGSLLLAQNFLMLAFACNFAASPEINCLAIIIVMAILTPILWRSNGVYRHWPKTILECFFFVNLEILAAMALYFIIRDRTKPQKDVSALLVGSAIIIFILLVIFHMIQSARKIPKFDRLVLRFLEFPVIKRIHEFINERSAMTNRDSSSVTATCSELELLHQRDADSYDLVISRGTRSDLNSSTSLSGLSLSSRLDEPLLDNYTNSVDSL